jgi:hypothetical protein
MTKSVMNQPATYSDNWYGPRPLQLFRRVLDPSCVQYGKELKLLKNGCNTCRGPVGSKYGNIISFSGGSGIRSATTNLSKTYYSDTASYLRSRGQNYKANVDIHQEPGIAYANANGPIWPETVQSSPNGPVNSSMYASNTPQPRCSPKLTDSTDEAVGTAPQPAIYKPNNVTFSTQGAVSSSTLILKRSSNAKNMPQLSAYDKKKKLKLMQQPFWGTLG